MPSCPTYPILEPHSQCDLATARRAGRASIVNPSEPRDGQTVGAAQLRGPRIDVLRTGQTNAVEDVEELGAELEGHPLPNSRHLAEAKTFVVDARETVIRVVRAPTP